MKGYVNTSCYSFNGSPHVIYSSFLYIDEQPIGCVRFCFKPWPENQEAYYSRHWFMEFVVEALLLCNIEPETLLDRFPGWNKHGC